MGSQSGQATVEWIGAVLIVCLTLGGAAALAPGLDGRSMGGFLAHRIACAARGGCDDGGAALARAYGPRDAELVRRYAPNLVYEPGERQLPVDYRRCRSRRCAEAPDDRDADVHRTGSGERATAFARVMRRGERTYLQYWLYYPDSNSTWAGSDRLWEALLGRFRYPGFHEDDWEGFQLRLEPNGDVYARATSHGHYQGCKQRRCRGRWIAATGWTRVSRGSHAGHIPDGPDRERTTTAEGLRLIPLETLDHGRYRPLDPGVKPPWRKRAYQHPEDGSS